MTKGEIDRLGQKIGKSTEVSTEDLNLLQEYRQTFQEPISRVFNYVLSTARKIDKNCIVTYRIKRIDTIIEKLRRFANNQNGSMMFSRMWDIAGCRCILDTPEIGKLYRLLEEIKKKYGCNCKINDYIAEPKKSGYRSIHIYVKDIETQKPIEIQIRNKNQHNWATLVEIVDLLFETKNKEQGAVTLLGKFLSLYSRATELSEEEFSEMLKIERKMKVFERMSQILTGNYLNIRRQWIKQKQKGGFFVITANKQKSEIISYKTFIEAETVYYDKYLENRNSNIVLTHLKMPNFEQINMAYSNYVLAMHTFFDDYRILLSKKIIQCVEDGSYCKFLRYFKIYSSNVKCHIDNLKMEMNSISNCNKDITIPKEQIKKWDKELNDRIKKWFKETSSFIRIIVRFSNNNLYMGWLVRNQIKKLSKVVSDG